MCMHALKLRPVSDRADVGLHYTVLQVHVLAAMQQRSVTQPWLTVCGVQVCTGWSRALTTSLVLELVTATRMRGLPSKWVRLVLRGGSATE